jgi:subtilisin family serine protease
MSVLLSQGGSMRGLQLLVVVTAVFVSGNSWATRSTTAPIKAQWALENTGQETCDMSGKDCKKGTLGADIKAKKAWTRGRDCSRTLVAVLDTGADLRHPDLSANLVRGKNFLGSTASDDPQDDNLHGTHVAGIIGADGDDTQGINGVCQKAAIMPVKIGSAEGYLEDSDILEGIEFAVASGVKVVNGSFGGGRPNSLIKMAIQKGSGTIFVFAAGNGDMFGKAVDIDRRPVYPASFGLPNIIVVAATDNQDSLGDFSNFGVSTVNIAAPGVGILSTLPSVATKEMEQYKIAEGMGVLDGTSMAAPYVAGAVAFLWSQNPSLSTAQVKARLLQSVDALPSLQGKVSSGGRLNLAKLVGQASFE